MQQPIEITDGPKTEETTGSAPKAGGCCGGSCACGSAGEATGAAQTDSLQTFEVEGLTCQHCVQSVTEEVSGLAGVESVNVTLVNGGRSTVSVQADAPLRLDDVRAAIEEAGYTLAGR